MRSKDIEDPWDFAIYMGEIVNPLGYVTFLFDEDKDWAEKAEHAAVLSTGLSIPIHLGAWASTGGYWANLPKPHHVWMIKKQMMHELYGHAARGASHVGRATARWLPFAAASAFAVDMLANPLDSVFMRGATALLEAVDPWGLTSFEMR